MTFVPGILERLLCRAVWQDICTGRFVQWEGAEREAPWRCVLQCQLLEQGLIFWGGRVDSHGCDTPWKRMFPIPWRSDLVRDYLDSVRERVLDAAWASPDEVRYAARIWVWVRWVVAAACLFVLVALPVSSTK